MCHAKPMREARCNISRFQDCPLTSVRTLVCEFWPTFGIVEHLENNDYHDHTPDNMPNILTGVVTKTGAMSKTITVTVR